MAIEAGLDPDLWGHERSFEMFVYLVELKLRKEHAGICKKIAAGLMEKSDDVESLYKRTVLRGKAQVLLIASAKINPQKNPR